MHFEINYYHMHDVLVLSVLMLQIPKFMLQVVQMVFCDGWAGGFLNDDG